MHLALISFSFQLSLLQLNILGQKMMPKCEDSRKEGRKEEVGLSHLYSSSKKKGKKAEIKFLAVVRKISVLFPSEICHFSRLAWQKSKVFIQFFAIALHFLLLEMTLLQTRGIDFNKRTVTTHSYSYSYRGYDWATIWAAFSFIGHILA